MTLSVRNSSVWHDIVSGNFSVKASSIWNTVQEGLVRTAGVWVQFFINAVYGLVNDTVDATFFGSGTAIARYQLDSDGDINKVTHLGTTDVGDWVTPKALAGATYSCRVTMISGTLDLDAGTGTWLTLDTTRTWGVQTASLGTKTAQFTIELAATANTSVILDSATITCSATRELDT